MALLVRRSPWMRGLGLASVGTVGRGRFPLIRERLTPVQIGH